MDHQQVHGTASKVERRVVEKNRRNQMKILYSKLYSLILPNYNPKESSALPLPDQIDEAINYIKRLETKVKMGREKKESLEGMIRRNNNKRSIESTSTTTTTRAVVPTRIEINETGSSLEVVLTCGLDNHFIFYEIIRILREENVDIKSANSSIAAAAAAAADSQLHVLHAEIPEASLQFGATKVSERLKRLVDGSSSDVEIHPELWDFEIIGTDLLGF